MNVDQTFIGTGELQSIIISGGWYDFKEIIIEGEEDCAFTLFSHMSSTVNADFSRSPSIENIILIGSALLENINLSNCVNLVRLDIGADFSSGPLKDIDLSDCKAIANVSCNNQNLSVLDINISNNPVIKLLACYENNLPLSNLYALSELIENDFGKAFGRQTLGFRRVLLNDALDYSSQKEFGGQATNFWILNGHKPYGYDGSLANPSEYTVNNGVITFHKQGSYTVDMRNPAIVQSPGWDSDPARAIVHIQVIDFVPVTEITNVPASVSVGEQYIFGSYRIVVLPENATYKQVTWEIIDAGTTGATIFGTRLRTTAPGTVKVRGTIKEGLAFDEDYTQDFVIEVTPLSIDEAAQRLEAIEVYPNPTTGELIVGIAGQARNDIQNVEIFDVYGGKVSSHHLITSSSNHLINISHLPTGTYFVKIVTEQGEVVRKVVKQ